MRNRRYTDQDKLDFYQRKIDSLKAKIASEHREPKVPMYEVERLYKRLDDAIGLLANLTEILGTKKGKGSR